MKKEVSNKTTVTAEAVELKTATPNKVLLKPLTKAESVFREDEEYRHYLPAMSEDSFAALEETIQRDGFIKDPLVIHHGKLLDGYARFEIAKKYGLDYSVVELDVETKEEALIWLVETHTARRHLTLFSIVEMYLKLKPLYQKLAKKNLGRKKKDSSAAERHLQPINTLQKIAEKANCGRTTVFMVEKILESKNIEQIRKCQNGSKTINQGYFNVTAKVKGDKDSFANREFKFDNPKAGDYIDKVINGDVLEVMRKLNSTLGGQVTCIISSPPYNCLEEGSYGIDMNGNRISDKKDYYTEYLPWLGECIVEFAKALRPGGRMILDIDAVRHQDKKEGDSYRHTIYADLVALVKKVAPELRLYHEIVWYKKNPTGHKHAGTRYSCQTPHIARQHEYILVWSKSKDSFELPNLNNDPTDIDPAEWTDLTSSVWNIAADKTSSEKYPHPAKMNQLIAERLIKLYSWAAKSNIILDAFCGSGSTAAAAEKLGRSHISIDLNPNFCELTQNRINEVIADRSKKAKEDAEDSNFVMVA